MEAAKQKNMNSYVKFTLMILTSTVVMYIMMYVNTYQWDHIYFSETRAYMALYMGAGMGAGMAVVMLAFMTNMYKKTRAYPQFKRVFSKWAKNS